MKKLLAFTFALFCLAPQAWAEPGCERTPGYTAIDMSQPTTTIATRDNKTGFQQLKSLGVKTVIRYYDWPDENITCKSLLPAESDAILKAGLSIITVFQHEGSDPQTFLAKNRGAIDAKHAIQMAGANGQPEGSAIYFAVDGVDAAMKDLVYEYNKNSNNRGHEMGRARRRQLLNASAAYKSHIGRYERFLDYADDFDKPVNSIQPTDLHPGIKRYFQQINSVMLGSGKIYKVGGYGSGAVCQMLLKEKLVSFCWLSQSTGWPGYEEFLRSKRWSMVQENQTFCSDIRFEHGEKLRFDFNRVNQSFANVGQWSKKADITPVKSLPKTCTNGWAR